MNTKPTYNIVSHAHWDREWYLSFEEYRTWLVDMVDDLFERMERDPDFNSFMFDGQMAMVRDYLEVRPEQRELFKEYVRKKKFVIGPWYVLVDQFIPSGESHIRNLMYGLEFARELGEPMMVGYIPDQFGHIAQMPQLLKGFGIDSAVIYRGFGGEPGQESSEYQWHSPDGSSVLMVHLPKDGYSFGYFGADSDDEIPTRFKRLREEIDPRASTSQRLVLNGGDHHWPDPNLTKAVRVLSKNIDANFKLADLSDYMTQLKSEVNWSTLPVVNGEMRFGLRHAFAVLGGTASSRMYVKQANYDCETKLERILEPLNAIAVALGKKSRTGLIKQAWMYVLQSQDHDVICGSSVDSVYEETMVRYTKAREIAKQTATQILNDLIPQDSTQYRDDKLLFLFNLLPHSRNGVVECGIEFFLRDIVIGINPDVKVNPDAPRTNNLRLADRAGREIPFQVVKRDDDYGITYSKFSYPHQTWVDKWKVMVAAENLPSLGYRSFSISRSAEKPSYKTPLRVGKYFLENEFVKVKVDPMGRIAVTDKESGEVYNNLNFFEDAGDIGDEYTYCPPDRGRAILSTKFKPSITVVERGPIRGAIQVRIPMTMPVAVTEDRKGRSRKSIRLQVVTTIYLDYNSKRINVRTFVLNEARDHRLRVLFNPGIKTDVSYADSQFCVVKRQHKQYDLANFPYELPQNLEVLQRFVTIQDGRRGLTVFSKGLHEYELKVDQPGMLTLTLLRCVGNLSNSGLKTRPGGDAGWKNETPGAQCIGPHTFDYSILVHRPTSDFEEINRQAEEYNSQILSVLRKHDVDVDAEMSCLELKGDGLAFSSLKESEDGTALVFRCYNMMNKAVRGGLSVGFPYVSAAVTDLAESASTPANRLGHENVFDTNAHGIRTLKIKL